MTHNIPVSLDEKEKVAAIFEYYDLSSEDLGVTRNSIGYVNNTYILETKKGKHVLRESNPKTSKEHVELEIEILRYLEEKAYLYTARVIANKGGEYLTEKNGKYYMLLTFLPGEVKASWDNLENFSDEMLERFFAFSAEFARIIQNFVPSKQYLNTSVYDYLKDGETLFESSLDKIPDSVGRKKLEDLSEEIETHITKTRKEFEDLKLYKLPMQLVHFDWHPGNVHFDESNRIVGLFDFDYAGFDSRLADLASTLSQSCCIFGGSQSGTYMKEKINIGLKAYRRSYGESEFDISEENNLVRIYLQGYLFFQLLWTMSWYGYNYKAEDSLQILDHVINLIIGNDYEQLFA